MVSPVVELVCGVQSYDWGKLGKDGSKVSEFAQGLPGFAYDENKPYAELWMGTHPSCPSTLLDSKQTLKDYLEANPELLGKKVVAKFEGNDLPFLFKVLAIRKALSIQAHPDKVLAKKLFDERPDIYKDPNHKPEMAVALTPFSGFCGFRPPATIAKYILTVPSFASLLGPVVSSAFIEAFSGSVPTSEETKKAGLKQMFSALMNADSNLVKKAVESLLSSDFSGIEDEEKELIKTLEKDFPGDVGIFCTFVLNIVHLTPGEAVFLKANEPHAYLDGDIMECMATSDNVVRAGLTPKLRDVPTLTSMLTYTSSPPSDQILPPVKFSTTSYTTLYDPPIEEFSVLLSDIPAGKTEKFSAIEGPSILIFTKLSEDVELSVGKTNVVVTRQGQVFFVGADVEVEIKAGSKADVVAYRAFVEA